MKKNNFLQLIWTGLLTFWIPLVLIFLIVKTVWPLIEKLSKPISRILPFETVGGEIVDSIVGVFIILLVSFVFGWIFQKTFLRSWSKKMDTLLSQLFPGYTFYKNIVKQGDENREQNEWKSVIVEDDDEFKLGFIIQKHKDDFCVVYIPGAPNPYEGEIVLKRASRLKETGIPFSETIKMIRQYGKGFTELYDKYDNEKSK